MSLKVISIDGNEPVNLDQAKRQTYISVNNSDIDTVTLLTRYIRAARQYAENRTWLTIIPKTLQLTLDRFPDGIIRLPAPPLISVDSITFIDSSGIQQTLSSDDFKVDNNSEPGRIRHVDDNWPTTDDTLNAVTITYKAGFNSDTRPDMRDDIISAILMMVKHWFDNRDAVVIGKRSTIDAIEVPLGANALLDMHSVREFV